MAKPSGQHPSQSLIILRLLACKVLARVDHDEDTLDEAVTKVLSGETKSTFTEFDRSWIYEICSGVLRHLGRLDYIIDTYALKKKPTGKLRRFLQTGAFQLLNQDTPPALIVSETVDAIRASEGAPPAQFANAILRKISDASDEWKNWTVKESTPFPEQLAWSSLPEWLFKRLRKERGSQWVFEFSKAVLERPEVWYNTPDESFILTEGFRGNEVPGFVQDISNQKLVDEVAAEINKRGMKNPKILDLCAAPGGKALGLAFHGFNVDATDIDEDRLNRVIENRSRLKLEDKIRLREFNEIWNSDEKWDVIWVDAPCSSIGIIRRHPEIKWNREESVLNRLTETQKKLQDWAIRHLTPYDGFAIYSTCSLIKAENEVRVAEAKVDRVLEWVPHVPPHGDGIGATVFSSAGEGQ